MQGDFSVLRFDPREHERGVSPSRDGVLRNINGVLHQQGRVTLDADLTDGELLELGWNAQAGRDIIGAGVAAVPASSPAAFKIDAAFVAGSEVHVLVRPGRAWVDGILTRLAGSASAPADAVERLASYFGPPIADPAPTADSIDDDVRDAVILEISEEALNGFQYPDRLIEAALGGPDTAERSYVNVRFRLLRLGVDEDCTTIAGKLADDPAAKGKLTVSLAPPVVIAGDCPVVGGGGYTGFEHYLYRVEIADTGGPARFKWSQWNGGLVGRGRFDATTTPAKVFIDAGRASIVNSGLAEFYLEALQYDDLAGRWVVIYGATATLNSDHDLELAAPPAFGALPSTSDPVFFRLWNGLLDISAFTNAVTPQELRDGIRLVFDAPAAGNYRPGDYWTFTVRAGEIPNPAILIDHAPPLGIVYHRAPLAEINWTGRRDTRITGTIEDCRRRFRPLIDQKVCCTFLIGDGVTSFGDFNSLEEAAQHLPASGGELCLLPGLHRANLLLDGRRNVTIHGCSHRSLVLPRTETRTSPIIRIVDCVGVKIHNVDLLTYDGIAVVADGQKEGSCRNVCIEHTRMIARINAIRATNVAELTVAHNRLHLLDTVDGRATVSLAADDVLVERNTLVMMPFVDETPGETTPDDDPTRDPADPCARPQVLYAFPRLVLQYATKVWTFAIALLVPKQPYRAIGGIHVRAGSERVRLLENTIVGGEGNGITLGGDLDPAPPPVILAALRRDVAQPRLSSLDRLTGAATAAEEPAESPVAVTVPDNGQYIALVQDESQRPLSGIDVYLEGAITASDRSDAQGMVTIKATPGAYTLDVSPAFRVVRVTESRDGNRLVNVVTVAPRQVPSKVRGFVHEITIQENDISMMGLSGIGVAARNGTSITGAAPAAATTDPRANLLAAIDAAVLGFAVTPLLRATDPVRDLVIIGNRIHHNLRKPFDEAMRAAARTIGRGGVSLAVVEAAVLTENHIYENGARAADPACGVFIGYGNDLEITDNVIAANGASTDGFEQSRQAGIRGGLFVRFAGAITTQSSTSSGRKPALRVHDNRVDQPAGRALTAFVFGPVSCANNHFNSELTGQSAFLDSLVGGVLIMNLGGIHRMVARSANAYLSRASVFAAATELSLPGGETMLDDNYVRLGSENRSLMSQVVIALDDVGFSANQASVFRRDPFFANAVIVGDSVRATASRFREDAARTISLLTSAFRMNMTSLNQADHCIIALPAQAPVNLLPTFADNNQVLDFAFCRKQFAEPSGIGSFFARVSAAAAGELGGTLSENAFSAADMRTFSRAYLAMALNTVSQNEIVRTKAYQAEAVRLEAKLGSDNPRAVSLKAQAESGVRATNLMATATETVPIQTPATTPTTAAVSGRIANEKGQGQEGYSVELVRADGTRVETIGRTDASGYYATSFAAEKTAALSREGTLFVRISDASGKEVFRATDPVTVTGGADVRTTATVPTPVVTRSTATTGTVIFRAPNVDTTTRTPEPTGGAPDAGTAPTAPDRTTPTTPTTPPATPTEPAPRPGTTQPGTTTGPTTPTTPTPTTPTPTTPTTPDRRTPLDSLNVDAAVQRRLVAAGINDVESLLKVDAGKLAEIVGDRTVATKLRESALRVTGTRGIRRRGAARAEESPKETEGPEDTHEGPRPPRKPQSRKKR